MSTLTVSDRAAAPAPESRVPAQASAGSGPDRSEAADRERAAKCRASLVAAGYPTYSVEYDPRQGQSILCLACLRRSYNPGDVAERYCSFCQAFHTEARS